MREELCLNGKNIWDKMTTLDDNKQIIHFIKHLLDCKQCRTVVANKFIIIDEYFIKHPDLLENINSKLELLYE